MHRHQLEAGNQTLVHMVVVVVVVVLCSVKPQAVCMCGESIMPNGIGGGGLAIGEACLPTIRSLSAPTTTQTNVPALQVPGHTSCCGVES